MTVPPAGSDGWPLLLGGSARPIGCAMNFIDRPLDDVVRTLTDLRVTTDTGTFDLLDPRPLPPCLEALDPMESPWTVEVLVDAGAWTGYLNNGLGGGDPTASADLVARQLGARCVMAMHVPRYGPGHAATQLWLTGPSGEPPLLHVRTLAAHAEDGRWSWHTSGVEQPWEQPERYRARRVRDRLDRELLVAYLDALGIRVDDPTFFGDGVVVRQSVDWPRRRVPVAKWRDEVGW